MIWYKDVISPKFIYIDSMHLNQNPYKVLHIEYGKLIVKYIQKYNKTEKKKKKVKELSYRVS